MVNLDRPSRKTFGSLLIYMLMMAPLLVDGRTSPGRVKGSHSSNRRAQIAGAGGESPKDKGPNIFHSDLGAHRSDGSLPDGILPDPLLLLGKDGKLGCPPLLPKMDGPNSEGNLTPPLPPNNGISPPLPPDDGIAPPLPPGDGITPPLPNGDGMPHPLPPPKYGIVPPVPPCDANLLPPPPSNDGIVPPMPPNNLGGQAGGSGSGGKAGTSGSGGKAGTSGSGGKAGRPVKYGVIPGSLESGRGVKCAIREPSGYPSPKVVAPTASPTKSPNMYPYCPEGTTAAPSPSSDFNSGPGGPSYPSQPSFPGQPTDIGEPSHSPPSQPSPSYPSPSQPSDLGEPTPSYPSQPSDVGEPSPAYPSQPSDIGEPSPAYPSHPSYVGEPSPANPIPTYPSPPTEPSNQSFNSTGPTGGTIGPTGLDCGDIAAGTASTDFAVAKYTVDFSMILSGRTQDVMSTFREYLQQHVAPTLAGCTGRRRLQESTTSIQNAVFDVKLDELSGEFGRLFLLTNRLCFL
jgi:hypothetical protein